MIQSRRQLSKLLHRHPLLYWIRYILLSRNRPKNYSEDLGCFCKSNKLEDIPQIFFDTNAQIRIEKNANDYQKALAIARFLRGRIKGGPGLGLASEHKLQKMLNGEGGVCSDFAQLYNIFCFINNIKVKEWGCIDRFYKTRFGHSFNEIYCRAHEKWIVVDVHKGIVFKDSAHNLLGAEALFLGLRNGNTAQYHFFSDYRPAKVDRIGCIYSVRAIPFLISNYTNTVNDHYLTKFRKFPPFVTNAIIVLRNRNHYFIFVMDHFLKRMLD